MIESVARPAQPTSELRPDEARFMGMKLVTRLAYCATDAAGKPHPLALQHDPEIVRASLHSFRQEATHDLARFARDRLVLDQPGAPRAAELKRVVAGHNLVAAFIMPLEYGGTLHHHNMMLLPAAQAQNYRQMIDTQVQAAPQALGQGRNAHVRVLGFAELGKNDFALFVLPSLGQKLQLPLQDGSSLLLHRKPRHRNDPVVRKAYRAAAAEAAERLQAKRADRRQMNQSMRALAQQGGTEPT